MLTIDGHITPVTTYLNKISNFCKQKSGERVRLCDVIRSHS